MKIAPSLCPSPSMGEGGVGVIFLASPNKHYRFNAKCKMILVP